MIAILILFIVAIVLLIVGIKGIKRQRAEKKSSPAPVTVSYSDCNQYDFDIAGVFYREDDIWKLATPNSEYDYTLKELVEDDLTDQVFKNEFSILPATIVPEPDNPHSADALKVMVKGVHAGYIRGKDNKKCRYLLSGALGELVSCSATFTGGEFKQLVDESDWDSDKPKWKIIKGEEDLTGTVTIKVRPADKADVAPLVLTPNDIKLPE